MPKLLFPVIIMMNNGTTTFYTEESPLIKIRKSTFDKRLLEGTVLIDSNGVKYQITNVNNLGYINWLWGLTPFLERMINVRIELQKIENLSLEEFKVVSLRIVSSNSDYYISSRRSLKRIIDEVNAAAKIEEITRALVGE